MLSFHLQRSLTAFRQAAHAHPRRVMAAVTVALAGFTATAFGVAPLAANVTAPPTQRLVTEPLALEGLPEQLDALARHQFELFRSTVLRDSDTADTVLRRLGVDDPEAARFLRGDLLAKRLFEGAPGKLLEARAGSDGKLDALVARFPAAEPDQQGSHFSRLTVALQDGQLSSRIEQVPLERQVRMGSATVRESLWTAADEARLPDAIAAQMIDIFAAHIDFHRELKRGDSFRVVFESLTADDQPITWNQATGRVLAAEYTNRGRRFAAVWFGDAATGKGAYYGLDGKSMKPAFLASPLEFSRVSSGFEMRMHPLLRVWQAHNGVDYAAPTGTPVKSVAAGKVRFAGQQQGYGNVVEIDHPGGKSTLYAHLSRIDVKVGETLTQGQVLGLVGATGWATGPHLHFEFKVNGMVQDPLAVARAKEAVPIDRQSRARFKQVAGMASRQLAQAASLERFRGNAE